MLYYLGKGMEFKKENCKEYKTIDGALRAAAKDETLTVWDENGEVVGGKRDNYSAGNNESDGYLRRYTQHETFCTLGEM